ncbi:MAG: M1 family metallopeptidase [Pseudomonadota bacterium]
MIRAALKPALVLSVSMLALAACGDVRTPMDEAEPEAPAVVKLETPPAGQLPEGVRPTAYRLALETDPSADSFSGVVEIDLALDEPHARIWLHSLDQRVASAKAVLPDGTETPAVFEGGLADGGVSKLDFETPLPTGAATIVIDYEAPYNFGLAGLYHAAQADRDYLASQMQAIDARRMTPSFDEPRFKTPWTLIVTAPAGDKVIANAPLRASSTLEDGRVRHEFQATRPIPSYLLALAVGPYDEVIGDSLPTNAVRTQLVPFRAFAAAGKGEKLQAVMDATPEMVAWQEDYFDYPYPYGKLDLIAAPDYAWGAMENAGAIVYREAALLVDERTSLARMRSILTIHAHELGHQWFGNLVTPAWWDDIWLNEAFATWISYKTMHAYDPDGGFDRSAIRAAIGAMGADSLESARQIRNPIERNADIEDAFDAITYRKGGGVLAMFETYLGEDAFRDGIRVHMKRYEDGVADVNDFMASLAEGSGQPGVVDAFRSFIFQPGIPYLDAQVSCSDDGGGVLTVSQSRYAPLGSDIDTAQTWQAPFAARVMSSGGGSVARQLIDEATTEIPLQGDCPDWVLPNAGGAGYWRFNTNADNWAALTESFTELTAAEQLVFVDSLTAAFEAGDVSADALLAGLSASAAGEWDAAQLGANRAAELLDLLDEESQPAMREWLRQVYGPLASAYEVRPPSTLSQGETLLRQTVKNLMAGAARDPEVRAEILTRAQAFVGVDGEPDPSAVQPGELGGAMRVGAADGGDTFFDAAFAYALASEDQTERGAIFAALASEGGSEKVVDMLSRAFDSEMIGQEILSAYFNALQNDGAREAAWELTKTNFEYVVDASPEVRRPQIARMAGVFCDVGDIDEAIAFIESQSELIPGYERNLAQSSESARLCAGLKAQKGAELAAALQQDN